MYLLIDKGICSVEWFQHHKPGKGGAYMKVKCRNIETGQIIRKTFRANEKVTQAIVDKKTMQFLYKEDSVYVFMDTQDYSQKRVSGDRIGNKKNFLVEGKEADLVVYEEQILDINLPPKVEMKVIKAPPGVKGNTVSGATKKVKLETGLEVDVPLFIEKGEKIIVDTRTAEYVSRAD
ncbi:MAG: elongation factor P [Elusimicrobiota bacterium]